MLLVPPGVLGTPRTTALTNRVMSSGDPRDHQAVNTSPFTNHNTCKLSVSSWNGDEDPSLRPFWVSNSGNLEQFKEHSKCQRQAD